MRSPALYFCCPAAIVLPACGVHLCLNLPYEVLMKASTLEEAFGHLNPDDKPLNLLCI